MSENKVLVAEIEAGAPLKHVDAVSDRSAPKIEEDVHLKLNPHGDLLKEVVESGAHAQLKHPDEVKDRSAPVVPVDVHVKTVDRQVFLKEVEAAAKTE